MIVGQYGRITKICDDNYIDNTRMLNFILWLKALCNLVKRQ